MGHRIFHRNNPLKSRSENHYKNKHISYKDVKYVQSLRMDPRTDRWSPDKRPSGKLTRGAKNYRYSCPNGTYFKWEKCGRGKDVKNVKSSLPSTSI